MEQNNYKFVNPAGINPPKGWRGNIDREYIVENSKEHIAGLKEKAQAFSPIYGVKKDELVELAGEERTRQLSLNYLKMFPGVTHIANIRKAKTRAMVNALVSGYSEDGNHFITCYCCQFHFFYRGTLIYKWDAMLDAETPVDAGEYEGTASTMNQRKEIKKSIENFRSAVFSL